MSSLQVRDLPDNIYYQLQKRARAEHRSLAQEAVVVLARGLGVSASNQERRAKLLESIAENSRYALQSEELRLKMENINPLDLVREDRAR